MGKHNFELKWDEKEKKQQKKQPRTPLTDLDVLWHVAQLHPSVQISAYENRKRERFH